MHTAADADRPDQAHTDFSGTWVRDLPPGVPPPLDPSRSEDLTITQTADTLVVQQMGGGQTPRPIRITYRLDGRETPQTINRADVVTRAAWDGPRLVTTVTGPAVNWQDTWSRAGDHLTVVTTSPGRNIQDTKTYTKLG